jgi:2-polyprenyl-6-methoxyphenol hydroxylase-like FAD-dependent oxidoreductase
VGTASEHAFDRARASLRAGDAASARAMVAPLDVMRTPFGPGWVLVGDAGYAKDPITAQGMLEVFADAERTAAALHRVFTGDAAFDDTMAAAHAARDEHAMPIYALTTSLATLQPPPPQMQQVLIAVAGNQEAMDAFLSVVAGALSPRQFFDPTNLERLLNLPAA